MERCTVIGRLTATVLLIVGLAGCEVVAVAPPPAPAPVAQPTLPSAKAAVENFYAVVSRVEPIAEQQCRARRPQGPCNFEIAVINNPKLPPNAIQTVDRAGRPVIAFSISLVATARNRDELAFILGHEAAHHIARHRERTEREAIQGARLGGSLASAGGADSKAVAEAQRLGAAVAARRYSKDYELEADSLGTRIAYLAGFDPLVGAAFFSRIPDPGDEFLGTHPPNSARIATVRRTVAEIRLGR
jgi:predicted Zn-dependent protease